jgi:hypothetical protein
LRLQSIRREEYLNLSKVENRESATSNYGSTLHFILLFIIIISRITEEGGVAVALQSCTNLRGLSPQANYTANFAGEGCCLVSATNSHGLRPDGKCLGHFCVYNFFHNKNSHGRYSRVSRSEPLLFHSIRSSGILTRVSGPCSRPPTSQKIW